MPQFINGKGKPKRHTDTKQSPRMNKSASFSKQQTRQFAEQQQQFKQTTVTRYDKPLLIILLKIAHVFMYIEAIYFGKKYRKTLS